jgi:hypothetical protein
MAVGAVPGGLPPEVQEVLTERSQLRSAGPVDLLIAAAQPWPVREGDDDGD